MATNSIAINEIVIFVVDTGLPSIETSIQQFTIIKITVASSEFSDIDSIFNSFFTVASLPR